MTNSHVYQTARQYNIPYTTVTIDLVEKVLHAVKNSPVTDSIGRCRKTVKASMIKTLELRLKNLKKGIM